MNAFNKLNIETLLYPCLYLLAFTIIPSNSFSMIGNGMTVSHSRSHARSHRHCQYQCQRTSSSVLNMDLVEGFQSMSHTISSIDIGFPMGDMNDATEVTKDMESARMAFGLCFFGAGGTAAVGRTTIPKTLATIKLYQSLKGVGTSYGGDKVSGLIGYPEDIYQKDIDEILGNNMTVREMLDLYPVTDRDGAGVAQNMLQYESFVQANSNVKPMAVRVVFDSMVTGINKMSVTPERAQAYLDAFRSEEYGIPFLVENNQKSKLWGISALVILLGLLGAADYFALYHLWKGWFPMWDLDRVMALVSGDVLF